MARLQSLSPSCPQSLMYHLVWSSTHCTSAEWINRATSHFLGGAALLEAGTGPSASCSVPKVPSPQALVYSLVRLRRSRAGDSHMVLPLGSLSLCKCRFTRWTLEELLEPSSPLLLVQTAFELLTHSLPFIKWVVPAFDYSAKEASILGRAGS
jgi:hypothetical protein